jgi:hypothetical protein
MTTFSDGVVAQFANDANEIFASTISDVWLIPGGILPANESAFPTHRFETQGKAPSSEEVTAKFKNGVTAAAAQAYIKKIAIITNPAAGTDTLTFNASVYTFVAAAPAANEILIGATKHDTATNIAARLTTDFVPATIQSATDPGETVIITGLAAGTNFTLATNVPAKLNFVTTQTGNGVIAGAPATFTVKCRDAVRLGAIVGTVSEIAIVLLIPQSAGGVIPELTLFQFDVPTTTTTDAEIMEGLQLILQNGLNNVADEDLPAGSRVIPGSIRTSRDQIAAALVGYFVADTAFTVSGTTLTLTAGANDEDANDIGVRTRILNSLPSPLPTIKKKVPQIDGIPIHLGLQDAFTCAVAPTKIDINASNFRSTAAKITTGDTVNIKFKLFQDNNPEFLKAGIATAAITYSSDTQVLLLGGQPVPPRFGIMLVCKSKLLRGRNDILIIYLAEAGALTIGRAKGAANGLDFDLTPLPFDREGDPVGVIIRTIA